MLQFVSFWDALELNDENLLEKMLQKRIKKESRVKNTQDLN